MDVEERPESHSIPLLLYCTTCSSTSCSSTSHDTPGPVNAATRAGPMIRCANSRPKASSATRKSSRPSPTRGFEPDRIATSPYTRCRQTAEIIANHVARQTDRSTNSKHSSPAPNSNRFSIGRATREDDDEPLLGRPQPRRRTPRRRPHRRRHGAHPLRQRRHRRDQLRGRYRSRQWRALLARNRQEPRAMKPRSLTRSSFKTGRMNRTLARAG